LDARLNAHEIKKIQAWGGQNGLLSVGELDHLMRLFREQPGEPLRCLEVGHYYGLSTCGLVHALRERAGDWSLLTVDSHEPDGWVGPTRPEDFERNREKWFNDSRLTARFERSQTLTAPLNVDAVFYDGDHAEEQLRFTEAVDESPTVRLFVFDDRDFEYPAACCLSLIGSGWRDCSPELIRLEGDKADPQTMTLGVFRR
jgi:hypothetical protein